MFGRLTNRRSIQDAAGKQRQTSNLAGPIGRKEEKMVRIDQLSVRLSLLLVAVVTAFLLIGGADAGAETPGLPPITHVVESGDTLWSIAAAHTEPGADVRVTIDEIMEASGLATSTIHPGQVLLIPQG
ncbi:MAG: LysM peptidoglycan-binding domain-containing protein [Actinomycetes bacterium]|jgi:LysM repeat protein|nr:MAG: hypothetical protein DIU67_09720 [Actinomycetota bacterium]